MSDEFLLAEMTVQAILTRWPLTAKVFNQYSSVCIGCAIAPYCTIADVARFYNLPFEAFTNDLKKVIKESDTAAGITTFNRGG